MTKGKKYVLSVCLSISMLLSGFVPLAKVNAETKNKFLVLVSSPLLKAENASEFTDAIDQYASDLASSNWLPTIISVNNVPDKEANYECPDAESLKALIRKFYESGYQGFVMIGSSPSLPVAWFHNENNDLGGNPIKKSDKYYADPCDVYFADMDTEWEVTDGNFVAPPSTKTANDVKYDFGKIGPEMFFGRIYTKGAVIRKTNGSYDKVDTYEEENLEIIKYLKKVHEYRNGNGPKLTDEEEGRYYFNGTCTVKDDLNAYLDSQFTNIKMEYDQSRSKDDIFFDTLNNEGFRAAYINSHGYIDSHGYSDNSLAKGQFINENYVTSDKISKVNSKLRLLLLTPCSSSRYISYDQYSHGIEEDCVGKSFLYNSDYMLNVYGCIAPTNLYYPGFYKKMFDDVNNACVGKAAQGYLNANKGYYTMQSTIYGDPTIQYKPVKKTASSIPVITSFNSNVEVKGGKYLLLPIEIRDLDSTSVNIEITGLPNEAPINDTVQIDNTTGTYYLTWYAPASKKGNTYEIKVRVSDNEGNKFEETFDLFISEINNGMLINEASGWTKSGANYSFEKTPMEPITLTENNFKGIRLEDGYLILSQVLRLAPNRDYKLLYYGVQDLQQQNAVSINIGNKFNIVDNWDKNIDGSLTKNFIYKNNEIYFNSGKSGVVTLSINIGNEFYTVNGLVALSGFRLVPFYQERFYTDISSNWYFPDEIESWSYEKGELNSEAGDGVKAVLSDVFSKNVSVESDVTVFDDYYYSDAGIMFRANKIYKGANAFKGYYVGMDAANNIVRLGRMNNDYTNLHSQYYSIVPGNKYHLKVVAIENDISVYVDDMETPLFTYSDENCEDYIVQGRVGLRNYWAHSHFDNVEVNSAGIN